MTQSFVCKGSQIVNLFLWVYQSNIIFNTHESPTKGLQTEGAMHASEGRCVESGCRVKLVEIPLRAR